MVASINPERMITFLLQTPMFEHLNPDEIQQLLHIVNALPVSAGENVFEEGEPGDAWYVLYRGELEVVKHSIGGDEVISVLSPPACFGEMAILDGLPRSATVRAAVDSTILRVPRTAFDQLLEDGDVVAYKLLHKMAIVLAQRERHSTTRLMKMLDACETPMVHASIREMVGEAAIRE